ncbi:ATP-binding protein [bacterium]|nr:ATP-binding protein [bacterium]
MAERLSFTPPDQARIVIGSTMLDVRAGLADLMACPIVQGLSADCLSTTEIVLAEALNNVVEHAYARFAGEIEVELRRDSDQLRFHIKDKGLPMPDAEPPAGYPPAVGSFDDLPEGGFGWFLIRTLSCDLAYRREGDLNLLSFGVVLDNAA